MSRELYQTIMAPVCEKYGLTATELIVLMFLANNPDCDTASDIVARRRLTKSAVSMAGRTLQEKNLIAGEFSGGNHRSIHLKIRDCAMGIIREGKKAQNQYLQIVTEGFSEPEKEILKEYLTRITCNISSYYSKPERKETEGVYVSGKRPNGTVGV